MNTRVITLIMFFMGLLLLNGCSGSGSGDSLDGAKNQPPTFPSEPEEPFNPVSPTEPSTGAATDDIVVRVEASAAMVASWQDHVFDLLTPAKAYAFRGLSTVEANIVEVVQVNKFLTAVSSPTVNIAHTVKKNADGTYGINFVEPQVPTARIDLMVRVQLKNREILWAPIVNDSRTIKVNVVSTFIVENLYSAIRDNNLSLANHIPCGEELGCTNQHEARSAIWQGMLSSAQSFDTTLPADKDIDDTKNFLSKQVDFMNFVNTGVDMVLNGAINDGFINAISKTLDPEDYLSTTSNEYLSVFFSMGMSADDPDNELPGATISTRTASEATKTTNGALVTSYPAMSEGEFLTSISINSIFGDIPFTRRSLTLSVGAENQTNKLLGAEINSLKSDPSSSFISTDGMTRYGRVPYQTITGKGSATIVGWLTNPFFSNFVADASRNYLLAAPIATGRAYKLEEIENGKYQRIKVLEDSADFNYMIHLKSTPSGDFSAAAVTEQKSYGVVSLQQGISATSDTLNQITVSTKKWDSSAGVISETQPLTSLPQHYSTLTNNRNNAHVASGVVTVASSSNFYGLSDALVNVYDTTDKQFVDKSVGRIALDQSGVVLQQGAVSPNGEIIATFTSNQSNRTKGFNHAIELTGATPDITDAEFYLQGHLFSINENDDELISLLGSTVSIDETQLATLALKQQYKSINLSSKAVSSLQDKQTPDTEPTAALIQNGQQIQLTFTDIFGKELVLKGFISADGNLLTLTAQMGNGLGVIYGFRKQNLPLS